MTEFKVLYEAVPVTVKLSTLVGVSVDVINEDKVYVPLISAVAETVRDCVLRGVALGEEDKLCVFDEVCDEDELVDGDALKVLFTVAEGEPVNLVEAVIVPLDVGVAVAAKTETEGERDNEGLADGDRVTEFAAVSEFVAEGENDGLLDAVPDTEMVKFTVPERRLDTVLHPLGVSEFKLLVLKTPVRDAVPVDDTERVPNAFDKVCEIEDVVVAVAIRVVTDDAVVDKDADTVAVALELIDTLRGPVLVAVTELVIETLIVPDPDTEFEALIVKQAVVVGVAVALAQNVMDAEIEADPDGEAVVEADAVAVFDVVGRVD